MNHTLKPSIDKIAEIDEAPKVYNSQLQVSAMDSSSIIPHSDLLRLWIFLTDVVQSRIFAAARRSAVFS